MRVSFLSLLLCLASAGSLFASDILPEEAAKYVGEKVSVRGKVVQVIVSKSSNVYLNFGGKHPNQTFAAAVLIKNTPDLLTDPKWLLDMQDKTIVVTGKVELLKDKPQIVVTAKEDLTVLPAN